MFNHLFINTRSSIDHISKQLKMLAKVISLTTSILFIGYYVYLIVTDFDRLGFLIVYSALFVLSFISLIFDIRFYLMEKDEHTRKEKRLSVEKRRKLNNILLFLRVLLKIATIVLSGIELVKYSASNMQIIMFTLSIILLISYLVFNSLIFVLNRNLDLMRLSVERDIANSKVLSKLLKQGNVEYTEQELSIIKEIEERAKKFLDDKDKKIK